jgi:hypothetical protein
MLLRKDGMHEIQWGEGRYPISRNLIVDGRENLILRVRVAH